MEFHMRSLPLTDTLDQVVADLESVFPPEEDDTQARLYVERKRLEDLTETLRTTLAETELRLRAVHRSLQTLRERRSAADAELAYAKRRETRDERDARLRAEENAKRDAEERAARATEAHERKAPKDKRSPERKGLELMLDNLFAMRLIDERRKAKMLTMSDADLKTSIHNTINRNAGKVK